MKSDFANAAESPLSGGILLGSLFGVLSGSALFGLAAGSVAVVGGYLADAFFPASRPLETKNKSINNQGTPSVG